MKFDLIDQVTQRDETSLSAVKNVSAAEEYLGDHFPGFPILPGVMMLETLVQAARHFAAGSNDPPTKPLVISAVRNVKYAGMVRPGQTLAVTVTLRKREGTPTTFRAWARLGNK